MATLSPGAVAGSRTPLRAPRLDGLASLGAIAAGTVLLTGSVVDLGILWLLQRQDSPQWEYVAIANTLEAVPLVLIGLALLYAALAFRRVEGMLGYRLLAGAMLLLGLTGAALAALVVTSYLAIVRVVQQPEAVLMLQSVALKSVVLGGLYFLVLTPLGALGLRRPRP